MTATTMTKAAYLTIDDSPSEDMVMKADLLLKKNIPAVFFCRGDLLERNPGAVIDAIEKGFIIGNHAFSHTRFSELSSEEGKEEIKKTDELIEAVYRDAGKNRTAKLFRFPYGDKGGGNEGRLQSFLSQLGYVQPKFEDLTYDWYDKSARDVWITLDVREWRLKKSYPGSIKAIEDVHAWLDNPKTAIGEPMDPESSEIVLMHDHPQTTQYFEELIDRLERMFTFKRLNIVT